MVGHICHIEAAVENGPRFRKAMTNEEENLILLCTAHHAIINNKNNVKEWTVNKLKALKKNHEKHFSEIGKTLARAFVQQFGDTTAATPVHQPQTLARLLAQPDFSSMSKSDKQSAIKALANLPKS